MIRIVIMGRKRKERATERVETGTLRGHLIPLALLGVCIFLAYSNSLTGTWALDDIMANKPVGIKDIRDLVGFRKVASLTFMLNQYVAPFSPASFRIFNILVHILNTVLVYTLAYKTMGLVLKNSGGTVDRKIHPKKSGRGFLQSIDNRPFYAALLSSIIFGLHPININAVAYIVQRMASLATLFVLLTLLSYIGASDAESGFKKISLYLVSGMSLIAGIFSKENAVMAVPLILLYEYVFLSRFNRSMFLKRVIVIAGISLVSIGLTSYFLKLYKPFLDVAQALLNPHQPLVKQGWMAVDVYWTPFQHILTEFRVVSRYLMLFFAPLPHFLVFDWWGYPVSTGLTEPITTILSMGVLFSLVIFASVKIRRFPMLCFGILWYLIAVSLESFLALGSDLYFEHRNYLPVTGLITGIVGQLVILLGEKITGKTAWSVVLVLCVTLGSLTFMRNLVWKNSSVLWEDTLRKNPSNLRALMSMGNVYMRTAEFDKAEDYYKRVVDRSSHDRRVHFLNDSVYSLGMLYLFEGEKQKAKELIDRFEGVYESYRPIILRGFYKTLNNDVNGALSDFNSIINRTRGIDSVVVLTLTGDAYRREGQWDDAMDQYRKALSIDPNFSAAYYGIGVSYVGKRDIDHALNFLHKALSLDPDHVLALSDMADLVLIAKSKPEDALTYAQRAVSKSPPFYQPYLSMANVLLVLGKDDSAENYYKKALEHGAADYMIPYSKARAYYAKGDREKMQFYISELGKYKDIPEQLRSILK